MKIGPLTLTRSKAPAAPTYSTQANTSINFGGPDGMMAGIFPGSLGSPPKRGTSEMLQAYSTMPWLRSVFDQLAYGVASTEWFLYVAQNPSTGKAIKRRLKNFSGAGERDPIQRFLKRKAIIRRLVKSGELREITVHPFLDLLDSTSDYLTGLQTRKLTQLYQDLVGEAFWLLERNSFGMPVGAWPVPAHWIRATPLPGYPYYRVSWRGWQGEIPETEIVRFLEPDPFNPYGRGTGLANSLGDDLETDSYATTFMKTFFFNGARPDIIVSADNLSTAETNRLEANWLHKLQGYFRAFRPLFVNRDIKVTELQQNNRNNQIIQIRQFERDTVQQVAGIPPELMGIIENSNRATIDASDYLFSRWCLVPRLENMRETLQERLIPQFDERLIVEYDSPVAEDATFHQAIMKDAPWAFVADEWRELAGKEPLPNNEGQFYAIPKGTTFTTLPISILHPNDPEYVDPGDELPEDQEEEAERELGIEEEDDPAVAAAAGGGRHKVPSFPPATKSRRTSSHDVAEAHEGRMQDRFLESVQSMRDAVSMADLMAAYEAGEALASGESAGIEAACQIDAWAITLGAVPEVVRPYAKGIGDPLDDSESLLTDVWETMTASGDAAAAELGLDISFNETNIEAVDWLLQHGADLVTNVSEATRASIRQILADSYQRGLVPKEAARRIVDVLGTNENETRAVMGYRASLEASGMSQGEIEDAVSSYAREQLVKRASTIARHETITASNRGQQQLWKHASDAGLIAKTRTQREWIATEDDRTCPICDEMDGVTTGIEEPWTTSVGDVDVPNDVHVNCRCSQGLVFDED